MYYPVAARKYARRASETLTPFSTSISFVTTTTIGGHLGKGRHVYPDGRPLGLVFPVHGYLEESLPETPPEHPSLMPPCAKVNSIPTLPGIMAALGGEVAADVPGNMIGIIRDATR